MADDRPTTTIAPGADDLRMAASLLIVMVNEMRVELRGKGGESADEERAQADAYDRVAAWLEAQANG